MFEYYEKENAVSNLKFDVNKKIDKNIQYYKKYIFSMFVNFLSNFKCEFSNIPEICLYFSNHCNSQARKT